MDVMRMAALFLRERRYFLNKIVKPVGFKLRVPFSPLHADGNHPVEKKEAGTWHSIGCEKPAHGKREIKLICDRTLKQIPADTCTILQMGLKMITIRRCKHSGSEWYY